MADFPTLPAPAYPIPVDTEDPALRSAFENGSMQTRAKFTRMRKIWTLAWPAMADADRTTLNAFYIACQGGAVNFTWTDQETTTEYDVRFLSYKEIRKTPTLWEISVSIGEI